MERKRWGAFRLTRGAKYEMTEDPDGEWDDWMVDLPSIHTGYWDPMFAVSRVSFNNSMASLGDYLFSGKMAQFPKLKIAYSEGQIDTTWPNSKAYCEQMLADVDEKQQYKILRGNAIRMLVLDRV